MAVATSIIVGYAIAAGASAGASIYSANKQSGAAKEAAQTQSTAATKTAQIQADSANRAAEIQAQSGREALDYSRGQSQVSLDQYNQQQQRLQPYRNLGNFALGMGPDAAPAPIQLPPLPGQSGQQPPQQPQAAAQDPAKMTTQIQESFQRLFGRPATDAEVQQGIHYGSKPDLYSDGKWRVGFNDYLATRIGTGSASADPSLAGTAGIIAPPSGASSAAPTARQPVTLGYQARATPLAQNTPLTAALQAPALRYRPLGSIGEY